MDRESLIGRIAEVLQSDSRVLAAWLGGSLGRGDGDRFSDVDVIVAVGDQDREDFTAAWDQAAAKIASLVLRYRVGAGPAAAFSHVTDEWLRFDVAVLAPADIARRTATTMRLLFDRADLNDTLMASGKPLQPSGPRVTGLTSEFLRILGLLPVVIGREEYAVGVSGASLLRDMLIQLMTQDVAVEDRGGALHLRALLPPDRIAAINSLPAIEATRQSVIAAHLAAARHFLPLARDLCHRTGSPWPDALEEALRAHLRRELDLEIPAGT